MVLFNFYFILFLATAAVCQKGNSTFLDDIEDVIVKINNAVGNDSDCCNLGERPVLCHSMDCMLTATADYTGSLTVSFESFQALSLTKPIVFQHFASVRLNGSRATIDCKNSLAGITFFNVGTVAIEGVSISGCGIANSTLDTSINIRAAVLVSGCTNVTINNTSISNSSGAGLFISNSSGGLIRVSHSNFSHNADTEYFSYTSGNGVLYLIENNRQPSAVEFKSCDFVGNTASGPQLFAFLSTQGRVQNDYGLGGGMSVIVRNSSSHTTFNVVKCKFMKNLAFVGGGVSFIVDQESSLFFLQIEESIFDSNGCTSNDAGSGGGAHFGMHGPTGALGGNHFILREVNFTNNCATVGGGTMFSSSRDTNPHSNNTITVSKCRWVGNLAHFGSAVDVSPHVTDRLANGNFPFFEFSDCSFLNNIIIVQVEMQNFQYALGIGTFFSSMTNIKFDSTVLFDSNHGTALMLVNANVDFSPTDATFIRNKAHRAGGAIALIGSSSMLIGPGRQYNFTENTARDRGGAIYVETIDEHDIMLSQNCFLHYLSGNTEVPADEWTASFSFKGNRASGTGHSIFISSLIPCSYKVSSNATTGTWALGEIFQWPGVFSYDEAELQIATDGSQISQVTAVSGQLLYIIPGEEYNLAIVVLDELNQTANNTLQVSLNSNDIQVDRRFSYISNGIVQLVGQPGETSTLLLETVSAMSISMSFNVVLTSCPPGFNLTSQNKCECNAELYVSLLGCQYMRANITNGYWIGYINNTAGNLLLASALCPREFCLYNNSVGLSFTLPNNDSELNEFICDPRRTGVLCGKCVANYTVFFNSPNYNCHKALLCNVGWLFYIFSEIIPITILFVLILAFDINLTSGAISGFILFSQLLDTMVVDGSGAIKWTDAVRNASWGYNLVYGIFRLNFFNIEPLSFCLFKDSTALDILAFKFISIGYAFFLILACILYLRYCGYRLGRFIRITTIQNSVIHGLAAFVVLSYAQGIYVSLHILIPHNFLGAYNKKIYPRRVWLNAEVELFSKEHLPYAIPAVLYLLTFGLFPPVILLLYPSLNRLLAFCNLDTSRSFVSLKKKLPHVFPSKFKPFLDTFQGYFKGNFRFFAGLYFFYRWVFLALIAFSDTLGRFYFSTEIVLIIILVIHTIVQPYKVRWHNIVDTLLFADLLIINTFTGTSYFYSRSTDQQLNTELVVSLSHLQWVFIYLPLIYFFCLLLVAIYSKCKAFVTHKTHNHSSSKLTDSLSKFKHRLTLRRSTTTALDEFPSRVFAGDTDYDDDYCDGSSLDVNTTQYDTRQRVNEGIF